MTLARPAGFRGVFRTDAAARAVYSEAAGIGRIVPDAVAVPVDRDDVSALLRWALDQDVGIVPRGSGSSMAGGAIGRGVVVDLGRLRAIGDPDAARRCIRVEAGILRGEVDRKAAAVGLRFPVDPSSGEFCTIGGMASTNAAGPHSLLHGAIRPWVIGLDCVFADGSQAVIRRGAPHPAGVPALERFVRDVQSSIQDVEQRRVIKDSSGYALAAFLQSQDVIDLLVGSEGTLAVFTAVELALIPRTMASASLFVSFTSLESAVEAAIQARERGAAACELLDRTFIAIAHKSGHPLPVAPDAEAALLVEVESFQSTEATAAVASLGDAFRKMNAQSVVVATGAQHEAELWSFRHAASPALAKMDPSLRSMQFIEDAAVPPEALASYVRGVRAALDRAETPGVIFGHAGDAHVHVNPLVDVARSDWRRRIEQILMDVTELVASLGGTLTGEHGDGRLRTPLLDRVWRPRTLAQFRRIKDAFDPQGILNPGVKVPLSGQRPIDVVKYDPGADILPEAARRALGIVERDRGYSRFRLDLL